MIFDYCLARHLIDPASRDADAQGHVAKLARRALEHAHAPETHLDEVLYGCAIGKVVRVGTGHEFVPLDYRDILLENEDESDTA